MALADISLAAATAGKQKIEKGLAKLVEKGKLEAAKAAEILGASRRWAGCAPGWLFFRRFRLPFLDQLVESTLDLLFAGGRSRSPLRRPADATLVKI